jgi:hypothetical protein
MTPVSDTQQAMTFGWGYAPRVVNLPGCRVIRRLRRKKLTPSTYASAGDFDNTGLSFAAVLETSARIAEVAASEVRRKIGACA